MLQLLRTISKSQYFCISLDMDNGVERRPQEGDSPTSSIDFSNLCNNFLIYYADYTKAIGKASYLRDPMDMSWVMFGVSGAGKVR